MNKTLEFQKNLKYFPLSNFPNKRNELLNITNSLLTEK